MSQTTGGGNNLGKTGPSVKNIPPTTNTSVLCSPSQINRGTALMRLAKKLHHPVSQIMLGTHNKKRMDNKMNRPHMPSTVYFVLLVKVNMHMVRYY